MQKNVWHDDSEEMANYLADTLPRKTSNFSCAELEEMCKMLTEEFRVGGPSNHHEPQTPCTRCRLLMETIEKEIQARKRLVPEASVIECARYYIRQRKDSSCPPDSGKVAGFWWIVSL